MHVSETLKTQDELPVIEMARLVSLSAQGGISNLSFMCRVTLSTIFSYVSLCVLFSKMGMIIIILSTSFELAKEIRYYYM